MLPSIFDKLTTLPLFIGMSREEISQAVGLAKFGFHKFDKNQTIVREGQACSQLLILIPSSPSGESEGDLVTASISADDHGYTISEELPAPFILEPDHLFGLTQRHLHTFIAKQPCHFVTLEKDEVLKLMQASIIFRLNLLNTISTHSQKTHAQLFHTPPRTLEGHITRFVADRCLRMAGPKHVSIKMTRLAEELNDYRFNISKALNTLQDQHLIELHRGFFRIPSFERLLQALH